MSLHFSNTHPVARKAHRCQMCGRRIDPGETYRRCAGMDGTSAWTWVECAHCSALGAYVGRVTGYLEDWDGYGPQMFTDWQPDTVEHLRLKVLATRRQWRRSDGTLYPVPVARYTDDDATRLVLHAGVAA